MSMLIRAELATAAMVMSAKIHRGNAGAPTATTVSSGVSPDPRISGGTTATDTATTSR